MKLPARILNAFAAPGRLGEALAQDPRWIGAMLLSTLLAAASSAGMWFSPQGKAMFLAELRKSAQGGAELEHAYPVMAALFSGVALIIAPVMLLLIAGVLWIIFTAIMGSGLGYRHHLSITSHAALISGVGALVALAIMLARGSLRSTLSLAAFVPGASETSPVYLVLALFDFFTLWWLGATAAMESRAGRTSGASAAAVLFGIYFLIGGAIVGVRAMFA